MPEAAETLEGISLVGGRFVASYLQDAHTNVKVYALDGKPVADVAFPGLGTANGFAGKPDDPESFYSFTSYTTPTTIYRYDVKTGEDKAVFTPKVDFHPSDYTTEQVFFQSQDGTRVPMFISYKKGLTTDGNHPTVLYGYGGFDISLTPAFSPSNLVWMEMGGIYAVPNLRGGGEYGEEWHLAGTKGRKQNVFDDFISCRRMADRQQVYLDAEAGHLRRKQRRLVGWRLPNPAAGSFRGGSAGGGRHGYAAVSEVHHRLGLGLGLWLVRGCGSL